MDKQDRLKKQIDFIVEIDKAKDIFRQTPLTVSKRRENDAEHSWHTALMIIILAEYFDEDIDILHAIKMMLMHDLVEVYAGDTYCYDNDGYKDKIIRETEAADKLYNILPKDQAEEYIGLWQEFEEASTKEALFCSIVDRLQPFLLNYATEGISWREHGIHKEQVQSRNKIIYQGPKEIKEYLSKYIEKCAEFGWLRE